MSPSAYKRARAEAEKEDHQVTIDEKPYWPLLSVDDDDATEDDHLHERIALVTAKILAWPPEDVLGSNRISVTPVIGGNTNQLFRVEYICHQQQQEESATTTTPSVVLCRLFGGAAGLIDRDDDTSTYAALASQGLALPYYGRFANGRLEAWCEGRTLVEADFLEPTICNAIAKEVARLHATTTVSILPPGTTTNSEEVHGKEAEAATLWTQLKGWLQQAIHNTPTEEWKTERDAQRAQHLQLAERLPQEVTWLEETVLSKYDSTIGYCHNDLLAANIMLLPAENEAEQEAAQQVVQLIDFEYGGRNYLSYDLANHFNEFAGGTDPSATPHYDQFPSLATQRQFCKVYLDTFQQEQERIIRKKSSTMDHGTSNDIMNAESLTPPPPAASIDALMEEMQGYILANHLVWGLWAFNQAASEGCEGGFDYLHYAKCRFDRYFATKPDLVQSIGSAAEAATETEKALAASYSA